MRSRVLKCPELPKPKVISMDNWVFDWRDCPLCCKGTSWSTSLTRKIPLNPSTGGHPKPQFVSDMTFESLRSIDHVRQLATNRVTMCQATNNKTTSKSSFGKIRHAVVTHCFELDYSQLCHSIQRRFVGTANSTSIETMASDNENSCWMRAELCHCGWREPHWFQYGWECWEWCHWFTFHSLFRWGQPDDHPSSKMPIILTRSPLLYFDVLLSKLKPHSAKARVGGDP